MDIGINGGPGTSAVSRVTMATKYELEYVTIQHQRMVESNALVPIKIDRHAKRRVVHQV